MHLPHTNGTYYTMCSLDADDPNLSQKAVMPPKNAKVDCQACYRMWELCSGFSQSDFSHDLRKGRIETMQVDYNTRMSWLTWFAYESIAASRALKLVAMYRDQIMDDDFLWKDVVMRHGFAGVKPWDAKRKDPAAYDHAQGNFWGMVFSMGSKNSS